MGNVAKKAKEFRLKSGRCGRYGRCEREKKAERVIVDTALMNADNTVPLFSLEGQTLVGKIVNVYDGDTCKVVFRLGGDLVKFNCRMNGYDTPEMRPPKNKPGREKEIIAAKAAKARLIELVMGSGGGDDQGKSGGRDIKLVRVKCGKFDKYGRLLTDVYVDKKERSVNQMLVDEGFGYPYGGGTKNETFAQDKK